MLRSSVLIWTPGRGPDRAREPIARQIAAQEALQAARPPRHAQRLFVGFFLDPGGDPRGVVDRRALGADQHDVAAAGLPGLDRRKHRRHRRVDGPDGRRIHAVRLEPLEEQAVVGQPIAGGAVVLLREEARDAGAEGIRRLGRDQIVGLARRQQHLARVADAHVHLRVVEDVVVDGARLARDVEHDRLELDDVDAFHGRNGAQPAGGAAGPEANHQRMPRIRMEDAADERQHHLRARIDAGAAVGLPVDDERIAAAADREGDAALESVGLPFDEAALCVHPAPQLLRRVDGRNARRTRGDAAVPPDRRWANRREQQDRRGRQQRRRDDRLQRRGPA